MLEVYFRGGFEHRENKTKSKMSDFKERYVVFLTLS